MWAAFDAGIAARAPIEQCRPPGTVIICKRVAEAQRRKALQTTAGPFSTAGQYAPRSQWPKCEAGIGTAIRKQAKTRELPYTPHNKPADDGAEAGSHLPAVDARGHRSCRFHLDWAAWARPATASRIVYFRQRSQTVSISRAGSPPCAWTGGTGIQARSPYLGIGTNSLSSSWSDPAGNGFGRPVLVLCVIAAAHLSGNCDRGGNNRLQSASRASRPDLN